MQNDTFTYVKDYILTFTSILYEAMPFILLGAIIAGVLEELVPQQFMDRVIPKNRFLAIALAGLVSLSVATVLLRREYRATTLALSGEREARREAESGSEHVSEAHIRQSRLTGPP